MQGMKYALQHFLWLFLSTKYIPTTEDGQPDEEA